MVQSRRQSKDEPPCFLTSTKNSSQVRQLPNEFNAPLKRRDSNPSSGETKLNRSQLIHFASSLIPHLRRHAFPKTGGSGQWVMPSAMFKGLTLIPPLLNFFGPTGMHTSFSQLRYPRSKGCPRKM